MMYQMGLYKDQFVLFFTFIIISSKYNATINDIAHLSWVQSRLRFQNGCNFSSSEYCCFVLLECFNLLNCFIFAESNVISLRIGKQFLVANSKKFLILVSSPLILLSSSLFLLHTILSCLILTTTNLFFLFMCRNSDIFIFVLQQMQKSVGVAIHWSLYHQRVAPLF